MPKEIWKVAWGDSYWRKAEEILAYNESDCPLLTKNQDFRDLANKKILDFLKKQNMRKYEREELWAEDELEYDTDLRFYIQYATFSPRKCKANEVLEVRKNGVPDEIQVVINPYNISIYNEQFPFDLEVFLNSSPLHTLNENSKFQYQCTHSKERNGNLEIKLQDQVCKIPLEQETEDLKIKFGTIHPSTFKPSSSVQTPFESFAQTRDVNSDTPPYDYYSQATEIQKEDVFIFELEEGDWNPLSEVQKSSLDKLNEEEVDEFYRMIVELLQEGIKGTNIPPLLLEAYGMISTPQKRGFLRELFFENIQFKKSPKTGTSFLIIKGKSRLRNFIRGTRYSIRHTKMNIISNYTNMATMGKSGVLSATKSTFKGNALSFFIVGSIDIYEYLVKEDEGKMFSDLLVNLGVDFAKIMIAGFTTLFLAGIALATSSVALPVYVIITGILLGGYAIGRGLDLIDEEVGVTEFLKQEARLLQIK